MTTHPTDPDTSADATTDPTTTSRTTTATEHYSIQPNGKTKARTRATRSEDSHLGILISWSGPASGRPQRRCRAVDLHVVVPGVQSPVRWRMSRCVWSPWS